MDLSKWVMIKNFLSLEFNNILLCCFEARLRGFLFTLKSLTTDFGRIPVQILYILKMIALFWRFSCNFFMIFENNEHQIFKKLVMRMPLLLWESFYTSGLCVSWISSWSDRWILRYCEMCVGGVDCSPSPPLQILPTILGKKTGCWFSFNSSICAKQKQNHFAI